MAREPVQDKSELLALIHEHKTEIRSFGVNRLGVFGSFVRGEQRPDSDIDLLVEFAPGAKTFDNLVHLGWLLEDLFRRRVELITLQSLSPYIQPYIMTEVEDAHLAD